MGSHASKFFIAIGFVLIFFALFFKTWKYSSVEHKAAGQAMWQQELEVKTQEPPRLGFRKFDFPSEATVANSADIPADKFKDSPLKKIYDEKKKKFDEGVGKEMKELREKADKGELDEQEDKIEEWADYAERQADIFFDSPDISEEERHWKNEVAEERAQRNKLSWHINLLVYFGAFAITIGFVMLSITGEGNEKIGAIIALGLTLWFISNFFGGL